MEKIAKILFRLHFHYEGGVCYKSYESKYHCIYKNKNFKTRFVRNKHPLHVFWVLHALKLILYWFPLLSTRFDFKLVYFRLNDCPKLSLQSQPHQWVSIGSKLIFVNLFFRFQIFGVLSDAKKIMYLDENWQRNQFSKLNIWW